MMIHNATIPCKLVLAFILLTVCNAKASEKNWRKQTYQTYIHTDFSSWPQIIEDTQKQAKAENSLPLHLEALKDFYGYVGHLLDTKQTDKAEDWAEKATDYVEDVKDSYPDQADVLAYESMFISFKIAISPYKAPFYVSSMLKTSNEALEIAPESLAALVSKANILYYFPSVFGGDKQQALQLYLKAFAYYKQNPSVRKEDWRYLFLLTTIANAYDAVGNVTTALEWANRALTTEPEFRYAKEGLMPKLKSRQTVTKQHETSAVSTPY